MSRETREGWPCSGPRKAQAPSKLVRLRHQYLWPVPWSGPSLESCCRQLSSYPRRSRPRYIVGPWLNRQHWSPASSSQIYALKTWHSNQPASAGVTNETTRVGTPAQTAGDHWAGGLSMRGSSSTASCQPPFDPPPPTRRAIHFSRALISDLT